MGGPLVRFAEFCVKRRIASRRPFVTKSDMKTDGVHLATWVSRETKQRFGAVATRQGVSESALLKRLVDLMLQTADAALPRKADAAAEAEAVRDFRVTIRLR